MICFCILLYQPPVIIYTNYKWLNLLVFCLTATESHLPIMCSLGVHRFGHNRLLHSQLANTYLPKPTLSCFGYDRLRFGDRQFGYLILTQPSWFLFQFGPSLIFLDQFRLSSYASSTSTLSPLTDYHSQWLIIFPYGWYWTAIINNEVFRTIIYYFRWFS
jgi:hypothetical protein